VYTFELNDVGYVGFFYKTFIETVEEEDKLMDVEEAGVIKKVKILLLQKSFCDF